MNFASDLKRAVYLLKRLFGISQGDSLPLETRRKVLVYLTLIGSVTALTFAFANIALFAFPKLGYLQLIIILTFLGPILLLARHDRLIRLAEDMLMVAAIFLFGSLVIHGGLENTGIYWVYIYPFVAFFVTDQRRGWYWTIVFYVVNFLIFAACEYGLHACPYTAIQYGQHFLVLLFFSVTAAATSSPRITLERDLEEQVEQRTEDAKNYLDKLQFLVLHDELTGLPNRAMLNEIVKTEINELKQGYKLVAAYLKMDRLFEMVNIFGDRDGDILIRQIAEKLTAIVGRSGKIARTTRDEFVVLFSIPAHLDELVLAGDNLKHDGILNFNGTPLLFHYYAGICAYPSHAANGEQLLRNAEQALLQALHTNVEIFRYDSAQDEVFVRHHLLYGKLQEAINQHQLSLFYQPQVDLTSGRITGVEALTRWRDNKQGFIDPAEFISVAEQSGLIVPFTTWMIEVGIRQCMQWHKEGQRLSVSLNMSAYNLASQDLIGTLIRTQEKHGLDPHWIVLEVTESSFMHQPEATMNKLQRLHQLGFHISIDDFGTGYSSLTYLKNLPVDEVKIDKSFIKNMLVDPRDEAIVHSTITLAHSLGAKVVAEGVEDIATAFRVKTLGCDIIQGYYYSEPKPAEELQAMLQNALFAMAATERAAQAGQASASVPSLTRQ